jgi:hypothetical protein
MPPSNSPSGDAPRERRRQGDRERETLIARLRAEADARDADLTEMRAWLAASESELEDLRAIRDALTPPELPERPGVELAAGFIPAADRVSGDFYLVAEPGCAHAHHIRCDGAVLRRSVQAARLDQRRAARARPDRHRLRHGRVRHLPPA